MLVEASPATPVGKTAESSAMIADYTAEVDMVIEQSTALVEKGKLNEAIELLMPLEKQTRISNDLANNSRLLLHAVGLCHGCGDWKALKETIIQLAKKRSHVKQAITNMVIQSIGYAETAASDEIKLDLIETLRTVTEGKIYLEIERAKVTRMLSAMKEAAGQLQEAADLLIELPVETFGSMDRRDRIYFILEQMRLGLAIRDLVRTQIMSRKISTRFFEDPAFEDLKLRYYELMIQLALLETRYLDCCRFYRQIIACRQVSEDSTKLDLARKLSVVFVVLAPFDNEQADLLHIIAKEKFISDIPLYKALLQGFLARELMRWPIVAQAYQTELCSLPIFDASEVGESRWQHFRDRVIEHNVRTIAAVYSRITLSRLAVLLDLDQAVAESTVARLVVAGTIAAKIDRPAGTVSFRATADPALVLENWNSQVDSLLDLLVKANHLIAKEEMIHQLSGK